ncbi:MAG: alpha/beta fold hydrolase [Polyangiaceae bacterium]|nr:alpha/beta fold hydrolase [Polyangiaceae bacterium]
MKLHVERYGDSGPSVVLCHGFGGSARNWRLSARDLKGAAQVVAFDARGHARSEAPVEPEAYELERFVEDVASVVDGCSDPVVLGGLSMGSAVALSYALSHPGRLAGLLLAACPRSHRDPVQVEWALGFAETIESEGLEVAGDRYAWGQAARFNPTQGALIRQGFLEHAPHALSAILRRVIAKLPAPEELDLGSLALPTRVVVGGADSASLAPSRALASRIPGAQLTEIQGGGHVVNLTHPAEFNAVLRELLAHVAASSR